MPHRFLLAALLGLLPAPVFAHSMVNGPHGGEVEDANPGPMHIETVVKGTTVNVFLSDGDGNAMKMSGVTGSIIVLADEKKVSFDLSASGADMLTGSGNFADDPHMKALVTLMISGQKQQALFSMLKQPAQ